MADPRKYKIVIVETGIGDPFLLGKFQFGSGPGITVPSEDTPLQGLQIKIEFSQTGDDGDFHEIGIVAVNNSFTSWVYDPTTDASPVYFFGLPFDPRSYEAGQHLYMKLTCTCNTGVIVMDNGDDDHSTFHMNYSTSHDKDFPSVRVFYSWPG